MSDMFTQMLSEPNTPVGPTGGGTLAGIGTALQGLASLGEVGLQVREEVQVAQTGQQVEAIEEKALAGSQLIAAEMKNLEDKDPDSMAAKKSMAELQRLFSAEEQGYMSPTIARARINKVINDAVKNNPVAAQRLIAVGRKAGVVSSSAGASANVDQAMEFQKNVSSYAAKNGLSFQNAMYQILRANRVEQEAVQLEQLSNNGMLDQGLLTNLVQTSSENMSNTLVVTGQPEDAKGTYKERYVETYNNTPLDQRQVLVGRELRNIEANTAALKNKIIKSFNNYEYDPASGRRVRTLTKEQKDSLLAQVDYMQNSLSTFVKSNDPVTDLKTQNNYDLEAFKSYQSQVAKLTGRLDITGLSASDFGALMDKATAALTLADKYGEAFVQDMARAGNRDAAWLLTNQDFAESLLKSNVAIMSGQGLEGSGGELMVPSVLENTKKILDDRELGEADQQYAQSTLDAVTQPDYRSVFDPELATKVGRDSKLKKFYNSTAINKSQDLFLDTVDFARQNGKPITVVNPYYMGSNKKGGFSRHLSWEDAKNIVTVQGEVKTELPEHQFSPTGRLIWNQQTMNLGSVAQGLSSVLANLYNTGFSQEDINGYVVSLREYAKQNGVQLNLVGFTDISNEVEQDNDGN